MNWSDRTAAVEPKCDRNIFLGFETERRATMLMPMLNTLSSEKTGKLISSSMEADMMISERKEEAGVRV